MVTVKDVALRAGVPLRMAERALSGVTQGKRRDARERAERIRQAARELGYQPSEVALSLKRGSTRTIGLLLPNLTDMFYAAASEIAMTEATERGYSILIRLTRFRTELATEGIRRFQSSRVDGILYGDSGVCLDSKQVAQLRKQKFPLLTFGHPNPHDFSSVAPDHSQALREAIGMLAARGHKSVTLAAYLSQDPGNRLDAEQFCRICAELGIRGEVSYQERMKEYEDLAAEHRTALLINGKYSMRRFLDRVSHDPEYRPDLIGFYNEWTWAQADASRLQGVIMMQAENSTRAAVEALIAQIEDRQPRCLTLPSRFYARSRFSEIRAIDLGDQYLDYDDGRYLQEPSARPGSARFDSRSREGEAPVRRRISREKETTSE